MLSEISIRRFAVIEDVSIEFKAGFNVLTGETGAGKSILIDALGALLGERLSAEVVRSGAEAARVEGTFTIADAAVSDILREAGIEAADGVLVITREMTAGGRGTARVNTRPVPISFLARLGERVADIHGQSDNLSLLRVDAQRAIVDAFGGLLAQADSVSALVEEYRAVRESIATANRDERTVIQRLDLIRHQVREIDAAAFAPNEIEALESDRTRLANSERLVALAERARAALSDASEGSSGIELVGQAVQSLHEIARIDQEAMSLSDQATALFDQAQELVHATRTYLESIDAEPARLQIIEDRLAVLRAIVRKYGPTLSEASEFARRGYEEIEGLEASENSLADLMERAERVRANISIAAMDLSRARREAADRLTMRVESELADLRMDRARFSISFSRREDPLGVADQSGQTVAFDSSGIDSIEFQIAANPGDPARSLARVASGGELARVMLAIKTAVADVDRTPVLVFDEVDTGVGGRSGAVIGAKLARIARQHQVLCVTHLPQVASFADEHFRIIKSVESGRARTDVQRLGPNERASELAAMLGGTDQGMAQACALLAEAQLVRARQD